MQISTTQDFAKVVANSNPSIDERELLDTGLFACNEYLDPINHSVFSIRDGDCTVRGTKSEKTGRISASVKLDLNVKLTKKSATGLDAETIGDIVGDAVKKMRQIVHALDDDGFDVSVLLNSEPIKLGNKEVVSAYKDLTKLACGEDENRLGRSFTVTTIDQKVVRHFRPRIDTKVQSAFLASHGVPALEAGKSD